MCVDDGVLEVWWKCMGDVHVALMDSWGVDE